MGGTELRNDFFISYNKADAKWAQWIAWVLEENGFSAIVQAWDFVAGSNFVLEMDRAAAAANRTIAVLSPDYLKSNFAPAEWAAAFAKDPEGLKRQLVPVRIRECPLEGLLRAIVHIDLVGTSESEARQMLLDGIRGKRAKPPRKPPFPGSDKSEHPRPPKFPGPSINQSHGDPGDPARYMPGISRLPSDLDKRRFVQRSFESIATHFEDAVNQLADGDEGVTADFTRVSDSQFTAELFVDGQSRRRCKVWHEGDRIAFSEMPFGWGNDNSFNELFTLVHDGLALNALMGMAWGDESNGLDLHRLTPDAAAEYLWRRFASRLG